MFPFLIAVEFFSAYTYSMSFSFQNFVYKELEDISHTSLGGKLKLFAFAAMLVMVYFGTILFMTSMRQLAYEKEFESREAGRVAGEQVIHSRFYVVQGE